MNAITFDAGGGVWFGTGAGLSHFAGESSQEGPAVTGIMPDSGANTGIISVTISGSNFAAGATARLTQSGQADISATDVNVATTTTLTCDLDLTGAAPGAWNVVVTNPDDASGQLADGFTVTEGDFHVYLPIVRRNFPVIPDAPVLHAIDNGDGDGSYSVSWSASAGATTYTLQEDNNAAFSSPTTVYSGGSTLKAISGRDVGTYYYRVQASNTYASSAWSNVQTAEVTEPLPAEQRPRITYYDMADQDLVYTAYDGSTWQSETVDAAGAVGRYPSLALDGSGRPRIAYYDATNADLKYAYYDGVQWQTQTVDQTGDVGEHASLALDASGRPHIAYRDSSNDTLKYAYHDGAGWQVETVPSATGGHYASLALDAGDHPHVAYVYQGVNYAGVRYAHHDGTTWEITEVTDGDHTALVLDADGYPHIGYERTNRQRYAYYNGTEWRFSVIPLSTNIVEDYGRGSIDLDADGLAHMVFHAHPEVTTQPWSRLGYINRYMSNQESVEFVYTSVDFLVGQYNSLVLDATDRPHVAYNVGSTLKYGYREGTEWNIVRTFSGASHHSLALGY